MSLYLKLRAEFGQDGKNNLLLRFQRPLGLVYCRGKLKQDQWLLTFERHCFPPPVYTLFSDNLMRGFAAGPLCCPSWPSLRPQEHGGKRTKRRQRRGWERGKLGRSFTGHSTNFSLKEFYPIWVEFERVQMTPIWCALKKFNYRLHNFPMGSSQLHQRLKYLGFFIPDIRTLINL